jgi:hypothetical protein
MQGAGDVNIAPGQRCSVCMHLFCDAYERPGPYLSKQTENAKGRNGSVPCRGGDFLLPRVSHRIR